VRYPLLIATALAPLLLAFAGNHATAADQSVVVATSVEQTHNIDAAMVEKLQAVEEKVSFLTGHGPEQATYTGALLWSALDRAEMLGGDRRLRLRRTIVVTGRDGYTTVPRWRRSIPNSKVSRSS
jgi:hypothetical protein